VEQVMMKFKIIFDTPKKCEAELNKLNEECFVEILKMDSHYNGANYEDRIAILIKFSKLTNRGSHNENF
jgi:hypothetical protein